MGDQSEFNSLNRPSRAKTPLALALMACLKSRT